MSQTKKPAAPTTTEVEVNWEGLKRFLGWQGSINDLKKIELDQPTEPSARRSKQ